MNRFIDKVGSNGEVYLLRDGVKIPYAELELNEKSIERISDSNKSIMVKLNY